MTATARAPIVIETGAGAGELVFDFRLRERVALTEVPDYRHLERWVVSASLDGGSGPLTDELGYVHVVLINLEPGRDITELVDTSTGRWVDTAGSASDEWLQSCQQDKEGGAPPNAHTLLLDRVWVEPRYRGLGFGPLIAAVALARLSRGCDLVACYPAPFVGERLPENRDREIAALARIWAKIGFVHWRDGVWMLDLRATDLHLVVARLLSP